MSNCLLKPSLAILLNSLDHLLAASLAGSKAVIIDTNNISLQETNSLILSAKKLGLEYFIFGEKVECSPEKEKIIFEEKRIKDNSFLPQNIFLSSLDNLSLLKSNSIQKIFLPAYLNLDQLKEICTRFPQKEFAYLVHGRLCAFFSTLNSKFPCRQDNPKCADFGLRFLIKKLAKIPNLTLGLINSLGQSFTSTYYLYKAYESFLTTKEKMGLKILDKARIRPSTSFFFLPQASKKLFLPLEERLYFLGVLRGKKYKFLRPRKELYPGEKVLIITPEQKELFFTVPKSIPGKGQLNLSLQGIPSHSKVYLWEEKDAELKKALLKLKQKLNQTYKPGQSHPEDISRQCF
jgi:hypothetical protein